MSKILETKSVFVIDDFLLDKLKVCADRLCAGSDAMRDEGNYLWSVVWQIQDNAAVMAVVSQKKITDPPAILFPKVLPEPENTEV